jgi:hypothetical protein
MDQVTQNVPAIALTASVSCRSSLALTSLNRRTVFFRVQPLSASKADVGCHTQGRDISSALREPLDLSALQVAPAHIHVVD